MAVAPLIVTAVLPEPLQQRFDRERAALFAPGRTVVGAHITLFHAVPGEWEASVRRDLSDLAAPPPWPARIAGVMSLGRGAAYRVESAGLLAAHAELRRRWLAGLTPQDRQPLRAHITVQNKVDPATARETVAQLVQSFRPVETTVVALRLWRYLDGPWQEVASTGPA